MAKSVKIISGLLGALMLMFGTLKFISPVSGFYAAMISKSGLPPVMNLTGHILEIGTGLLLMYTVIFRNKIDPARLFGLRFIGSFSVIAIMLVAAYVHLHPNVPAEVLPLAKPPVLPAIFITLAAVNIYLLGNLSAERKAAQFSDESKRME